MRRLLLLVALIIAGCASSTLAPFGQLRKPVGVAYQVLTGRVFVSAADGDLVRVFDAGANPAQFLLAPVVLFPLSIPTVPWPAALAAGDRTVFVMSPPTSSLGFIDTTPPPVQITPPQADDPRSVVDGAGIPIEFPLGMLPAGLVDFTSGGTDHALVVGSTPGGTGRLLAVTAQVIGGKDAEVEAALDLGDALPAALALEDPLPSSIRDPAHPDTPIVDCRAVAIADDGSQPGHVPGVLLTHATVGSNGVLSFTGALQALPVRVPLPLADGTTELRAAPVRFLAFTPAPTTDASALASIADPCAQRSGRLFVILDPVYCGNVAPCPDAALIDLPSGDFAFDQAGGGALAIYDVPGAALEVGIPGGPFSLASTSSFGGGFERTPLIPPDPPTQNTPVTDAPALALVSSTTGGLFYFSPGLGTYLCGADCAGGRAASDTAFPVDGTAALPHADPAVRQGEVAGAAPPPALALPSSAQPITETVTAAFRAPLPGFSLVGTFGGITGGTRGSDGTITGATLRAPAGPTSFLTPLAVIAGSDVILPQPASGGCQELPITLVAPDGLSLEVTIPANEPDACKTPNTPLAILPGDATPWLLSGSETGFIGRLRGCGPPRPPVPGECLLDSSVTPPVDHRNDNNSNVFGGTRLLYQFVPPVETDVNSIPQGATWTISVSDGFSFVVSQPAPASVSAAALDLLPAGMAVVPPPGTLPHPPTGGFRLFVAYSGSDALVGVDPQRPGTDALGVFQ